MHPDCPYKQDLVAQFIQSFTSRGLKAGLYGYPKEVMQDGRELPGLVQIHGGGQYADHKACLVNAKRGYATVSIAWAGRISAPDYRVSPNEVKLFWDNKTDDPGYKLTTDWGAVDGYHAPGRNPGNVFPSAKAAAWTLDDVESPRNSGWFLCALAARRALTFLEQQPEVDPNRLGVYGHSMGGKLTVMTAVDPRVKAAGPSCGGISDRDNASPLYRATLGDDVSLRKISCPIISLSPANDFHGRIDDLPDAIAEINIDQWRVTCSPHHNHQDTPPYEVATLLWMDQHLQGNFSFPQTPKTTLSLNTKDRVPSFNVQPDLSKQVLSVDVFLLIGSFVGDWEKEWFTYKPAEWARRTHKIRDETYAAPDSASLALDVLTEQPNRLVVLIDDHAAEVDLTGGERWQTIVMNCDEFRNADGGVLESWKNIKRLKLSPAEHLQRKRG
ncbi:MAG: dienelactone hydrolase family protein, partial [Planctomycetes bacterium]|nr:dienelactone hydrolase family protein [Planctomycetota bacterium]